MLFPPVAKRFLFPSVTLVVVGFLAWGLWKAFIPQSLPLQGQIEAQEVNVSSKISGRVGQVYVSLGQTVKSGDPLFDLDSPEVQAKITQARSALASAQAVAAKANAGSRPEEIEMARLNWERAKSGARMDQLTYERVQAMFAKGLVTVQKRDEAQTQWRASEQQAEVAAAQYEMYRKGPRSEDKRVAQAQAQQMGGVVSEAEVALAETRIKAPTAGEVSKIQIQPGELAPQGFPVITLVNLQDIWAVLQVREDLMSAYTSGSRHTADVPALKRKVDFVVTFVGVMPDFATWRAARPGGTDLRTFEIRLRPVNPVTELRPGMSVVFQTP